jgi:FkbM family methyltransferase
LYKIINWYTRRFKFPRRGWKWARSFMQRMGLLNRIYTKKLHNGLLMYVNPSEHIQQQLFWYGYYEKEVIQTWESLLHTGFVVLDIGANAGYYSLIAAIRTKQVYAFEPSLAMRQQLESNIKLNAIRNISVEPCAVSDRNGTATLYLSSSDNSGMTGMQPAENFSGVTQTINTVSIDEWIVTKDSLRIDMIKIDVEGAEMKVLEGMKNVLEKDHPGIFIEIIPSLLEKYGSKAEDVFQFLDKFGYTPHKFSGNKKVEMIKMDAPLESEMFYFTIGNMQ